MRRRSSRGVSSRQGQEATWFAPGPSAPAAGPGPVVTRWTAVDRQNADRFLADLLRGNAPAPTRRRQADLFFEDLVLGPRRRRRAIPAAESEQAPAAPAVVPVFPGFDVNAWDDHLVWLWRWSNLRFVGFYLAHLAGSPADFARQRQRRSTWLEHWHDLKDIGWGLAPFWVPFTSGSRMATADGAVHGNQALAWAREARLERGAVIYLDIEGQVFDGTQDAALIRYMNAWFRTVRDGGYVPGAYCSRLDASRLLGADFRDTQPLLYPVSIATRTRADWNDTTFQLTPTLPGTWDDVGGRRRDPTWAPNAKTVGCQYDWFREGRDRTLFHWPSATGRQDTSRDVDWGVAKAFDPSHYKAAGAVAAATGNGPPRRLHAFCVRGDRIEHLHRPATATGFEPAVNLGLGPADIGPTPSAERNGFDPSSAAAVSRRAAHADLFVLGLDGFVRTTWVTDRETFPRHPWALHPDRPARKGSPLAAVSREIDQLDVFYVGGDHQLVTQWWSPSALNWARNRRTLAGPLVAGGSNIAALGQPPAGTTPGRLDVFYVSLDYGRAYAAPPAWNNAWQVVHGLWTTAADWRLAPIAGLDNPAAATGVAAARDTQGTVHVVVQTRDRLGLRHATLAPAGARWNVGAGPGPLPALRGEDLAPWWMSLHLAVCPNLVLLVGMTSAAQIAWASWAAGRWSAVQTAAARFSTGRPLALALRAGGFVDAIGLTEGGELLTRSFEVARDGTVRLP
jgi:hypothetical protein